MKTLWFKAQYVPKILNGTKTYTDRQNASRLRVGDVVAASVGPIRPFAILRITAIETVAPEGDARALYPDAERLTRIWFELLDSRDTAQQG